MTQKDNVVSINGQEIPEQDLSENHKDYRKERWIKRLKQPSM